MYFNLKYSKEAQLEVRNKVVLSRLAEKQIGRLPAPIARKLYAWVCLVEWAGIREVRRRPGFHDEPLQGKRFGQRLVRLNRSWRVIYVVSATAQLELVELIEVNHHEY